MGLEYALVHVKYTIPPAALLTYVYWPLFTRRDVYRIAFLLTVAVTSTIPWDSYLIRTRIWTYPPRAVLGPTLLDIPVEELFFFVVQTYGVSLLYMLCAKPTFYPTYLQTRAEGLRGGGVGALARTAVAMLGQIVLCLSISKAVSLIWENERGTYMGLIVAWSFPFIALLWSLSQTFALSIPQSNLLIPIVLPTLYLWMVDTFSLQRGTWVIEGGTKYGVQLWDGLEVEEAFFFLVTNVLVTLGQVAFDNACVVIDTFPHQFPEGAECPSPVAAVRALCTSTDGDGDERILALREAVDRLSRKSRSFYLASAMFQGRLRIDLILLYSFCRVADDLVDNASDPQEARHWIDCLRRFLDLCFASERPSTSGARGFVESTFPRQARAALLQLPVGSLTPDPLYGLLRGFDMDLQFASEDPARQWPIADEVMLETYGHCVAGTVAELCLDLVFTHARTRAGPEHLRRLKGAAVKMGIALQTVNIARDIQVDAGLRRVYIPLDWLEGAGLAARDVLADPRSAKLAQLRSKLLAKAFGLYDWARPALEQLPEEVRGPMRVAIESYMEIGRVLQEEGYEVRAGKATVPLRRRVAVAWTALRR